jgi:Cu-Zn family superoxide dismutase
MQKYPLLIAAGAALLAFTAGAQQAMQAQTTFVNSEGTEIGAATLTETPQGVLIEFVLNNVPTGEHGFHIHETGACDAPDFQSAGGHYNPTGKEHGYKSEQGYHAGDMPNQFAWQDNVIQGNVLNTHVTLGEGDATLFDEDGSALILHSGPDDYASQPSGDAGSRIACAVIEKG